MLSNNCIKRNNRVWKRCLRDFYNSIRQLNGLQPRATIAKIKRDVEVSTANDAYAVLADLQQVRNNGKYAAASFRNEEIGEDDADEKLRKIFYALRGKTVRAMYIIPANEVIPLHAAGDDETINRADGITGYFTRTIVNVDYDIPADDERFKAWWESKVWDWRVSDHSVFIDYDWAGYVYVSESLRINPKRITQTFLDNKALNCVFAPIIERCEKTICDPLVSASKQNKHKTVLNKINKLLPYYKNGVPENELDNVFKQLKLHVTLSIPFAKEVTHYGLPSQDSTFVINYINTRFNHVDAAGDYYNNDKPIKLPPDEFYNMVYKIKSNKEYMIYQLANDSIYAFKTLHNSYKLETSDLQRYFDFENRQGLNNCKLDDARDELLSKFIRCGSHQTCSRINPNYKDYDIRVKLEHNFKEIDGIKAYTKFKLCKFYRGFATRFTDFRQTDKIVTVGYYLIGNIDWTNADKQLKCIQRTFNLYAGRNIFASPELEMIMSMGVKFKILGGCWGIKSDFEFDEPMLETHIINSDDMKSIPHYSRWTGMCASLTENDNYYMDTDDIKYAEQVVSEYAGATYNHLSKRLRFSIRKEHPEHKCHIAGFIFAYQRMNLVQQLMTMDISKIIRINTDGIKYIDHDFDLIDGVFKPEKITTKKINGLLMGEHEQGLITNINNCNPYWWAQFHLHFSKTKPRTHYMTELFAGPGGCGKTHVNLTDIGLVRPLYVANAYKLTAAKHKDYNCDTDVVANLFTEQNFPHVLRKYNTIIIDEASMINEETRIKMFDRLGKHCKLVFCGDIGYQVDPSDGKRMDVTAFEHITTLTVNFRCLCPILADVLTKLRDVIDSRTLLPYDVLLNANVQFIKRDRLIEIYNPVDMILTYTNSLAHQYTEWLSNHKKYRITKSEGDFNRGEIYFIEPDTKHYELAHGFTTHSVQGETFHGKIYIDIQLIGHKQLIYTAISRARYFNQIYIVTA